MADRPSTTASYAVQAMLREYLGSGKLIEVAYRDSAGQICLVHDVIRELCSRAGQDFLLLGRGTMLPFDHLITINGRSLSDCAG
ncbi:MULTISPECIES: hypothetical protein [Marinobacter]|uniref:Rho-binding antiterminator n=1 Tax=Marinobacter metalliresistant TaxID=2961995 RepID=A0ABZ2W5B0_9GAMM|nr:hypothetical protein [Marinobacter sp. Arc7-DN-1]AXS82696.1 hypothetical protein D0851_06385 [Marinobacter sp. Arc7-DN-1]